MCICHGHINNKLTNVIVNVVVDGVDAICSTERFHDAVLKHQEAAERHLNAAVREDDKHCSTSDDEDDDDDVDVFKTLTKSFNLPSGTTWIVFLPVQCYT